VDALRRRASLWLFGAAAAAYLVDRVSKIWAERTLPGDPIDLIEGAVTLRFTTNSGGAFSVFPDLPWFFAAVSTVIALLIAVTAFRHTDRVVAGALGLVLGGAVGNLTDRLVRGSAPLGEVVDFIDLHVWPVFNLADSAVVGGAILLALASWRRDRGPRSSDA
jgi:signal peptidase II